MSDGQTVQTAPLRVAVIATSWQERVSLQALVEANPAFEFLGSAADAEKLVDCLAGSVPDVVVTDIAPEASDALKTLFELSHALPSLVLLSDDPDSDWILDALPADAAAILPRNAMPAEIVVSIEAVAAGLCVVTRDVLVRLLAGTRAPRQKLSGEPLEALTLREIGVLAMLADGLGNKEIARQLDISDNTVKFHLSSIFGKLGATNRTEAVMLGMRHGFIMV
ncbi:response regulator transcription factor (plasmid) [Paraburkholderia sprentiae WSM5005]|uniref:Response regulator transcription factor n=1 Tax=Paraburkholderia sprentiae WSM5005 TaxID=754502 RepID=A0A1I9YS92_9BURK|nr:response regulator transcription factor [Paraburkholderia sprentiae]APA89785.1 response regulator transcription factor [Paraburkholderia sprentiae WSM5005]